MAQPVESLPTRAREPDAEPQAIEATLNYIVDDGTKIFTETGAPGAIPSPVRHAQATHGGQHAAP